jgi:hypothetical protein
MEESDEEAFLRDPNDEELEGEGAEADEGEEEETEELPKLFESLEDENIITDPEQKPESVAKLFKLITQLQTK